MAKKKRKGLGKVLQKISDKSKKFLKDMGSNLKFAPLVPFYPVMVTMLNKRGVKHGKKMEDVVEKFINNIVKKKKNFDDFGFGEEDVNELDFNSYNVVPPELIEGAVQIVIEFFKQLKKRKDAGEKLSTEEEGMLNAVEQVTDSIKDGAEEEAGSMIKEFLFSWKGGLLAVALILVIIFAFKD